MEDNIELRERIRNSKNLRKFLNDNITLTNNPNDEEDKKDYIEEDIKEFFGGKHNDVVCVIRGIRNLYTHGFLTPSPIMKSGKDRDMFFDMSQYFLNWMDDKFSEMVDKMDIK